MSPFGVGTGGVLARYDGLAADVAFMRTAPATELTDPSIAALLHAEARWLDHRDFRQWLNWCHDDVVLWVPLDIDAAHPASDQSMLLDDRRRLDERVWRFCDPNAWALIPPAVIVRSVSAVETWRQDRPDELLVSSVLALQVTRGADVFHTVGRQLHRLRSDGAAWKLLAKTLLLPALSAGTPHLGWLM